MKQTLQERIKKASRSTPDPARAKRNLERFFSSLRETEEFLQYMDELAMLFAYSQFLTNFVIKMPREINTAMENIENPITMEKVKKEAAEFFRDVSFSDEKMLLKALRHFKKSVLLRITLRDILKKADFFESMEELSSLADTILQTSLEYALLICQNRYGDPSPGVNLSIISLGKLGGYELNYSSDLDIMGVYNADPGKLTSGVLTPTGLRHNRITNQEFYSKTLETLNRLLTLQTGDGICYRLDFRLRPQGQRGALAYSLKACEDYYQTWGRTWERMVLIRARPAAGDKVTGKGFLKIIEPFVWRSLDYGEIEEIRNMKKKIDTSLSRDDIKRGYGGIREIEFFIQTLQLLYGAEHRQLRTHRLFNAIQTLRWLKIIPSEELSALWENYLHLRRIEHYLQMLEDLQTHTLPKDTLQIDALSRKMGFDSKESFLKDLRIRRKQVRSMYNSLLGSTEEVKDEMLSLIEGELSGDELKEYLSFKGIRSSDEGLKSIQRLKEKLSLFRTTEERAKLRDLLPLFLNEAFNAPDPDRALRGIEEFFSSFGSNRLYTQWFLDQKQFVSGLVSLFSSSKYLTRLFLSDPLYMDLLLEEAVIRKSLRHLKSQIHRFTSKIEDYYERLVEFKKFEELRVGLFYLMNILRIDDLLRNISHIAEAVVDEVAYRHDPHCKTLIVGMGKLGGREMTYGSDLDIIFVSFPGADTAAAEKVIKDLTTYTDRGMLYEVDMRLRPDGSKGTLIKSIEGYRDYYLHHAQPWEIQALIKSRPLRGDSGMRTAFRELVQTVFQHRAAEIDRSAIEEMRKRIVKNVSMENEEAIDIKFGPGGLEEIEFYLQYLQAAAFRKGSVPLIQNTLHALKRLRNTGFISREVAHLLLKIYLFFRKVETLQRLNEEKLLRPASPETELIARILGFEDAEGLIEEISRGRKEVLKIVADQ